MADEANTDITALTVQLLSAFVSNNVVPSEGLADLIKTTRSALTEDLTAPASDTAAQGPAPAVSIRKSLASPDHILSLIDGKPYKTLKRHLATHDLTPEQYRERYNLPKSYPLVAPSYSEARRAVAEKLGLGKKPVSGSARADAPAAASKAGKNPPKASPAKASSAPVGASTSKPAEARSRKRLSIAAPKAEKPVAPKPVKADTSASTAASPESAVAKTAKPKAATAKSSAKAKPASKDKAPKAGTKPVDNAPAAKAVTPAS